MEVMYFPTVMIVEDEELTALYLEKRLTAFGIISILTFSNGKDAISCVQNHKVDIVIMDVEIEGDWDGIETAFRLKKIKNIPIIFLSAHSEDVFLKRVAELNPLGYLLKPLREESLRVMLNLAVHKLKHEAELEQKDKWLSAILNNLTETVIGIDLEGKVIFINPVGESLLGVFSDELMHKPLVEFIQFFDEDFRPFLANPILKALENGIAQFANNVTISVKNKTQTTVSYSISILFDDQKQKMGAVLCLKPVIPADAVA